MSALMGLGACGVSVLFFGSMFVPIKKFDAGDGLFVQWVMSGAIVLVGWICWGLRSFPGFYPLAIFGLFGMKAHPPASSILNYLGLALVLTGGFLFSRVKGNADETEDDTAGKRITLHLTNGECEKLNVGDGSDDEESGKDKTAEDTTIEGVEAKRKASGRGLGIVLALISGCFYGLTFVPVIYMQDNPENFPGAPVDGLSYVFSHYFGIFISGTALFLGYAIFKKNKPIINPEITLPSFAGGLMWAIAQSSFFIANDNLSQAVTFPIITTLPGCVASLWSILYFREIKGQRNLTTMAVAIAVTLTGASLVGLSKIVNL
ncbi:unnamed protein product, partial [Mesorhabditis spiculigera]